MAEIITNADAEYAFDIVKTICAKVGPGLPGTFQERERAAIIKKNWTRTLAPEMWSLRNSALRRGPS